MTDTDLSFAAKIDGKAHWTTSGGQPLLLWTKKTPAPTRCGTVLFIHGSSMSSRPTFDLQIEGMPEASVMNWFATRGFDCWTFDCRGYGESYKDRTFLGTVAEGVEDAAAATDYIMQKDSSPFLVYGISSGALRAAAFAERYPERVARLAMDAMVWTGNGSPTLESRRLKLDQWRRNTRRPIDRAFILSIFNRDHPGTVENRFIEPFIEQVLAYDRSMPNGTYIDMCANLPLVDPARILMPALVMRGEYDGIASMDDLLGFFANLPNPDKEFAMMPGIAHASFTQKNFLIAYQILLAFFMRPSAMLSRPGCNKQDCLDG